MPVRAAPAAAGKLVYGLMFPKAARVGGNLPAGRVYLHFFRIALHADGLSRVFDRDGTGIGIKADRRKRVYPDASA